MGHEGILLGIEHPSWSFVSFVVQKTKPVVIRRALAAT